MGRRPDTIVEEVASAIGRLVSVTEIERILREFVSEQLVYEENGAYLSLALPLDGVLSASQAGSTSKGQAATRRTGGRFGTDAPTALEA